MGLALRLYRLSGNNGALAQRLSLAAANSTNPASSTAEHGGNLPTVDVRADRFHHLARCHLLILAAAQAGGAIRRTQGVA